MSLGVHASTMPRLCPHHQQAKQRKQSPKRLREAVSRKLDSENIDLTQPPYTTEVDSN